LFAFNLIKDETTASDIVLECFEKLWKARYVFQGLENVKYYLYRMVRNACFDWLKSRQRQRTLDKELQYRAENDQWVDNEKIDAEFFAELHRQIEGLPEQCRNVFKMMYYESLNSKEVAERMKINRQTVLNHKSRAIELLKSKLLKTGLDRIID
jgi:RNA polymerase sigma-70 factor (family 1)